LLVAVREAGVVFYPNGIKIIQPKVARNELPWVSIPTFINPERVASIPHMPFVKFNLVAFQEIPKLILQRNTAMMFLLPGDVIPHRLDLRKTDGENTVAILPREIMKVWAYFFSQSDEPRLTSLTISAAWQVRDSVERI